MTSRVMVLGNAEPFLQSGNFHDENISNLPPTSAAALRRWNPSNWLATASFAAHYCYPPAQRVAWLSDDQGSITAAAFYREHRWARWFKCISLTCPCDPRSELVSALRRHHPADMLRIPFLSSQPLSPGGSPGQRIHVRKTSSDYELQLPETAQAYLRGLGQKTRKHLPYYARRIEREWGSQGTLAFSFCGDIARAGFDALLGLNRLRLHQRGRRSLWTAALADHRWPLVQESGFLVGLYFRESLAAGTLSFVQGDQAYLVVIAHDPGFDRLNLGNVILWRTIEQLIASRCRTFHLMWGDSPYKIQFGAVPHPLYEAALFSNRTSTVAWNLTSAFALPRARSLVRALASRIRSRMPLRSASGPRNS